MKVKPATLNYGVDEKPTLLTTLFLGLEHIIILSVAFIFPILLISAAHDSVAGAFHMIQATMLAMGITTILLALSRRFFGSGYLACAINDPAYLPMAFAALKIGGLPLLYTINYLQSIIQILFAEMIFRIRRWIPVEITGVVILMIGFSLIRLGVSNSLGGFDQIFHLRWDDHATLISISSLLVMMAFSVWGGKYLAKYGLLFGVLWGVILTAIYGDLHFQLDREYIPGWFSLPSIESFPVQIIHWSYVWPLLIAVFAVTINSMGNLVTSQKVNNAQFVRPNYNNVRKGLLTTGFGSLLASLFGGMPLGISSINTGLAITTHSMSRVIAFPVGIVFILVSFFPHVIQVFLLIPKPVLGAMIIYVVSSLLVIGTQTMLSRMMNPRRLFIIGVPIIVGLAFEFMPQLQHDVPGVLWPLVASPLTTATLLALILNFFFQIGVRKTAKIKVDLKQQCTTTIHDQLQKLGSDWGALPLTIARANKTISDTLFVLENMSVKNDAVAIVLHYNEYSLEVEMIYQGQPVDLSIGDANLPEKSSFILAVALRAAKSQVNSLRQKTNGDEQRLVFTIEQ
jgi:NCS2 family nucleobase:cation symporter-2